MTYFCLLLSGPVIAFLEEWCMENLEEIVCKDIADQTTTKVFLNGNWVGVHRNPDHLMNTLKGLRRCVDIESEVSIVRDIKGGELKIYTDQGRMCRPLFIVGGDQKLLIKKKHIYDLQSPVCP